MDQSKCFIHILHIVYVDHSFDLVIIATMKMHHFVLTYLIAVLLLTCDSKFKFSDCGKTLFVTFICLFIWSDITNIDRRFCWLLSINPIHPDKREMAVH